MTSLEATNFKSILIVEDEPSISNVCDRTLSNDGFEIDIAANGIAAQHMIEKKNYTLCLVDIQVPEMNGIEFFQWLGDKHPEMSDRVIFTTGKILCEDTILFIEQSGIPFLPKPFTPDDLQSIVSETINHNEQNNGIRIILQPRKFIDP